MKEVKAFAAELSDAYSTRAYGGWVSSIRLLRKHGYTDREIEAIIRSRWSRWANVSEVGHASPTDLLAFVESRKHEVERLVRVVLDGVDI